MNEGLFAKYIHAIKKRSNSLEEIVEYIEKETGVLLVQDEIVLQKKTISFQTSSVKKVLLRKQSIQEFLKGKGYVVKM